MPVLVFLKLIHGLFRILKLNPIIYFPYERLYSTFKKLSPLSLKIKKARENYTVLRLKESSVIVIFGEKFKCFCCIIGDSLSTYRKIKAPTSQLLESFK